MLSPTSGLLATLPKAELHVHLDGSLRPGTLATLARERDVELPLSDPAALGDYMVVSDARNLEEYLARFELTLAVMQDAEALERIARELAEDHARESVRWLEVRFCPALNTRAGLSGDEVLDAVLRGLRAAEEAYDIRTRIIVCALRTLPASVSVEMAELAVAYHGRGVCAFDLAGAEKNHPVRDHLEAFDLAAAAGLPVTVHAGEAYGAPSLRQAVQEARAQRLGHGTRLREDPGLLEEVRRRGIALEICLTSNLQTRVTPSYERHPLREYFDAGLALTLCTDNRLMSGVTLTEEYVHARDSLAFTGRELVGVARMGFEHAFAQPDERAELLRSFDEEVAALRS